MGSFANSIFTILLGWFQSVIYSIWNAFTTNQNGSLLAWIGRNWKILAVFLCLAGLVLDFAVYMARWKPFKVWASFFRSRKMRKQQTGLSPAYEVSSEEEGNFAPEETVTEVYDEPTAAAPEQRFTRYSDYEPERNPGTEEIEQRIVRAGRRRRSARLMSELNDGQGSPIPPVDEIINSDDAYYKPVYPKNWREQENYDDQ
jgi:hypothetical protein